MPSASGSTTSTVPTSRPWQTRQTVRYAKNSVKGLVDLTEQNEQQIQEGRHLTGRLQPDQGSGSAPHSLAWSMPRLHTAKPSSTWGH